MTNALPPIDLAADKFSLQNARVCLVACRISYDEPSNVGIPGVQIIDAGSCVVVAFEGSHSWADWKTNLRVAKAQTRLGRIHSGFWSRHNDQLDAIRAQLVVANGGAGYSKPVIWTGHSLGAALAILGAADSTFPVHSVYTFEGPRIGNGEFQRYYNAFLGSKTFRIVNEEDIVPRVPLWTMGYRHVAQQIFLPSDCSNYLLNPPLWRMIVSDVVGEMRAISKGGLRGALEDPLEDHPLARDEARVALLKQQ